jgi:Fe-S cluster assembly protein SufD
VSMEAIAEKTTYLADFEEFAAGREEPESVRKLRRRAIERFEELSFPTPRQEEWRFTDVSSIAETSFRRASAASLAVRKVEPFTFPSLARLTFVNGHFDPELSRLEGLPEGVVAGSLAEALARTPEIVEPHLARYASFDRHPFVALNTALAGDGAFLVLPKGVVLEEPVHLLFLATAEAEPTVAYPRVLVVAEESAQAQLVESYVGLDGGRYFNCPVTEIVVGDNASLDHYKVQQESVEAFHLATLQIHQGRDSNFSSHSISTGGALVRHDVNAVLGAEGCDAILNGLYIVTGRQFVDNHMRVEHAAPHCTSHELYRGILDQSSRGVFNGLIYVRPGAQKTDAIQSNRNLLLSREALVNSNPQLEIFADDVKCTHGSTVGQIDEDAVFYLRSRGISAEAARSLLTYAFASEIVDRIRVDAVRHDLEELLFRRLPKGEVVRDAV